MNDVCIGSVLFLPLWLACEINSCGVKGVTGRVHFLVSNCWLACVVQLGLLEL